jgi:DNA-binding transcriptional LysR family regulator
MDPRRLRLLRVVALAGSVAGAARTLHLTPPAVSQQLTLLEREVGTTLMHRSRHGVTLTAAGQRLAMRAERIEQELLAARRDIAELTGQNQGTVRLAAFQSVMQRLIVPALDVAAANDPAVQVEVVEAYGPSVIERLHTGELDAAIIEQDRDERRPRRPGIRHIPLMFDAYRVVVPTSWHIEPKAFADLNGRSWVAGPPGTACDVALRRLLDRLNVRAEIRDVCVEFPSVLALVAAGRGAAIVPQLALGHPGTVTCPQVDIGGRNLLIAHRRSTASADPPLQAIVRALAHAADTPVG